MKGKRTKEEMITQATRILVAFPELSNLKLVMLKDRFAENGFDDKKIIASVDNVIDTYKGDSPSIAEFIQYGKDIKAYTYEESIKFGQDKLAMVDIGADNPRWVLPEVKIKYKLPDWGKREHRYNTNLN